MNRQFDNHLHLLMEVLGPVEFDDIMMHDNNWSGFTVAWGFSHSPACHDNGCLAPYTDFAHVLLWQPKKSTQFIAKGPNSPTFGSTMSWQYPKSPNTRVDQLISMPKPRDQKIVKSLSHLDKRAKQILQKRQSVLQCSQATTMIMANKSQLYKLLYNTNDRGGG